MNIRAIMPSSNMELANMMIQGNLVDVVKGEIFPAEVYVQDGKIVDIKRLGAEAGSNFTSYILPGYIDSHIHIESSMLTPSEFARVAVRHGTVGVICDPHEIANVLGLAGVHYMIENAKTVPFHFFFGAPSCVPSTPFETSGASLGINEIYTLLSQKDVFCLAEMMNFPGVVNEDPEVIGKLRIARELHKPIDGHAPGLTGKDLTRYISQGISTDHECSDIKEAREKIKLGMKILVREGSAAKNFDALFRLIDEYPDMVMLCSDDKHADDLLEGHINLLVKRALANGIDLIKILRAVSYNPIKHYSLPVGLLQKGDSADFIVCQDLKELKVSQVYIQGNCVFEKDETQFEFRSPALINNFNAEKLSQKDLQITATSKLMRVIEVVDGQLLTKESLLEPTVEDGKAISDPRRDILKLVVLNRYEKMPPAIGFVKNFGLKSGALAQSIGHDSHNIIAVGTNDDDLIQAINTVIENQGGMCAADDKNHYTLPLPIAGLISNDKAEVVSSAYQALQARAKALGSTLHAPWMTLSFLALPVIPELKLTDRGLFSCKTFSHVKLFV